MLCTSGTGSISPLLISLASAIMSITVVAMGFIYSSYKGEDHLISIRWVPLEQRACGISYSIGTCEAGEGSEGERRGSAWRELFLLYFAEGLMSILRMNTGIFDVCPKPLQF